MREPERIDRITNRLNELWHKHPDQRLGQLLANYIFGHHRDIFHQEDEITEARLRAMFGTDCQAVYKEEEDELAE
jgi:hypothetical protein